MRRCSTRRHTGSTPTFTPEETANLGFAWSIGESVRVITDARYVGERLDGIPTRSRPIPSSTLPCAWTVGDAIGLTLKADNIFDELYATAAYQEDQWMVGKPRTASVSFDFSF